tara:strand:- start:445 stop:675 length:231 start_codon:yes stop_codon:yes gene_type:complete
MEISKLSHYYWMACDRMHNIVDDLYEDLHDDYGVPLENKSRVDQAMEGVRVAILQELDLIKTAIHEYEDIHSKKEL